VELGVNPWKERSKESMIARVPFWKTLVIYRGCVWLSAPVSSLYLFGPGLIYGDPFEQCEKKVTLPGLFRRNIFISFLARPSPVGPERSVNGGEKPG
jgi:hypothetical protein